MKSDHVDYNLKNSVDRINQVIASRSSSYEERDKIPACNELTYTNGFYAKCTTICIEIRKTPEITDFYKNTELIKLYRTYISEVTAVMNGNPKCAEINMTGNRVLGVFDTPFQEDVDEVFSTRAKISSIIDIMNYKFKKNNIAEITVGIGISFGKGLVVKTGYKGSSVSEVVWMGDVVEEATKLASYGNKEDNDRETMVSEIAYYNLNEENREMLSFNSVRNCFHGDIVNSYMNKWYKQNCP